MERKYPRKKRKMPALPSRFAIRRVTRPSRRLRRRLVSRSSLYRPPSFFSRGPPPRTYVTCLTSLSNDAYAPGNPTSQLAFTPNDHNDPFAALGAAQSTYYDQYAALYEKCCVMSGSVTFRFHDSAGTLPTRIGLYFDSNSNPIGTATDWVCLPGVSVRETKGDEGKEVIIRRRFDVGTILGRPHDPSSDGSACNVSPSEKIYCHVMFSNAATNVTGKYIITFALDLVFFGPKRYITQSS